MSALEVRFTATAGAFPLAVNFVADAPVTALFGRSGSGKTSILHALAGLLEPEHGRIACDGAVLFDSEAGIDVPAEHRRIGYVFQESLLFPHLSVEHNLTYGSDRHRQHPPLVSFDHAVDLLDLRRLLHRAPATLSGGEARRTAIGRALLSAPRLLLLDEPLAGLDADRRNEIMHVIERLRDDVRLPIVFVSHAVGEVTRLADTMVVVADGRSLATGPVEDVMNRLELRPHTGRYEAGAVLPCVVRRHDPAYELTTLSFAGGELELPRIEAPVGERVRVRIRARDVALASERPGAMSTRNVLAGRVAAMTEETGPVIDVAIAVGDVRLIARITRRSRDELGLAIGAPAWALVKSVSLDRRSAGYG